MAPDILPLADFGNLEFQRPLSLSAYKQSVDSTHCLVDAGREMWDQEDVKKLICWSFRDFIFDPKCLPTPQRSPIRHPRAIFLTLSSLQILKSIFSHLPDEITPKWMGVPRRGKTLLALGETAPGCT
jgi:hypothetical protein